MKFIRQTFLDFLMALARIKRAIGDVLWKRKHEALVQKYGGKENIPTEALGDLLMPNKESMTTFLETMDVFVAVKDVHDRLQIKQEDSLIYAAFGACMRAESIDEAHHREVAALLQSETPRRFVLDSLLRHGDLKPHRINYLIPQDERADFEAWLDEKKFDFHKHKG